MLKVLRKKKVFPPEGDIRKGLINVFEFTIEENDGSVRSQFIWERGHFVVVVIIDEHDNLILKREFKYGQMRKLLTFVSGAIKKGEDPIMAALREMLEEVGMESDDVRIFAGPLCNSPDKSTELHYFVIARNARFMSDTRESGEIVRCPVAMAHELLKANDFTIAIQRLALHEAFVPYR